MPLIDQHTSIDEKLDRAIAVLDQRLQPITVPSGSEPMNLLRTPHLLWDIPNRLIYRLRTFIISHLVRITIPAGVTMRSAAGAVARDFPHLTLWFDFYCYNQPTGLFRWRQSVAGVNTYMSTSNSWWLLNPEHNYFRLWDNFMAAIIPKTYESEIVIENNEAQPQAFSLRYCEWELEEIREKETLSLIKKLEGTFL